MLGLCVFSLILGFAVKQLDSKADTSNANRNIFLDYICTDYVYGITWSTGRWIIFGQFYDVLRSK
ncbi:unnamed protein product [Oppiella nova]|uniref:Uncharacterized protein n=1 Tax=Oppiella nova TaxID=334625 RepID=A0A7R9QY36_9ACAR|nr:unnamed protein product [Oppiella nova]CAG2179963.1 unnamed protein product [Oppiella nova]